MKLTKKLAFFVLTGVGLGTFGIVQACKTANSNAGDSSQLSANNDSAELRKAQINQFTDAQKKILAAKSRNASGQEKLNVLWDTIVATQQDAESLYPPVPVFQDALAFGNGSAQRFWKIFEGFGNEWTEVRPEDGTRDHIRLTHRYGVYARMRYIPKADTTGAYTGIYRNGSEQVLVRLSSAVPTSVQDRFTPALSAKFFVDGNHDAVNLITQHDIGGQSSGMDYRNNPPTPKSIDWNFYTNPLSNRLSFERGVPAGAAAFSRFYFTAQVFAKKVGLDITVDPRELSAQQLAEINPDGTIPPKPNGPRFVWMIAPKETGVKERFAQRIRANDTDFRRHFLAENKLGGSRIYFNVYGSDTWTYNPESDAALIGTLESSSDFVASEAADVRLYFKHRIEWRELLYGSKNVYTRDYPPEEWMAANPKDRSNSQNPANLFTYDCRLGVLESEVQPAPFFNSKGLHGTFLSGAILNPLTQRWEPKANGGQLCVFKVLGERLARGNANRGKEEGRNAGVEEFTDPVQDKINRPNGDQTINNLDDPAIMRDLTPADPNKHFPTF
jgi:hypothetical protein